MKPNVKKELTEIGEILNFYHADFYCNNCGKHQHRYVRKGITLIIAKQNMKCDNCDCKMEA